MTRTWFIRAAFAVIAAHVMSAAAAAQTESREAIRLTLDEAVQRAIEHNPDLAIVRLDTEAEAARVGASRGAFVPVLSTTAGRTRNVAPPANALLGNAGISVNDWFATSGVRQRLPRGGGTWSVSWDTGRTTTNNPITSFDPNLQSGIQLAFSQPLLRDRTIDTPRSQYVVAKRNRDNSELRFRESVVQTVAAVKRAYWALKAAIANVDVQQRSLELAQELARQNRIRVDAGQVPPVDLVQAEAEVASRREGLIQARTTAEDAEDQLRRLMMDPADASFWKAHLDPVEAAPSLGFVPDADAAAAQAVDTRSDIVRAGRDLENARTTVELLKNQRLPDVRLETLYRGSGLGGTQLLRTGEFPGIVTATRNRSFGDALGQAFSLDYPTWSVGVTVSYALGHSYEDATLARAEVEHQQVKQRISSLRLQAVETIRKAGRQVRSGAERVDAARATATLAEQRYNDEQRRYDVGLSTTFLVTQAQRDLLQAQVGLLQTQLDYQSALVNFDAVQQAPPPEASGAIAVRGADIVLLPTPAPRGVFRAGGGQ